MALKINFMMAVNLYLASSSVISTCEYLVL